MCGITGFWSFREPITELSALENFTDSLAHRGPDSRGSILFPEANLYLGHRRLSILDLSRHGHQPMTSADRRYVISFNGEIYNFIEIREELKSLGYTFSGDSDSEVLLNAFSAWGKECVQKFNGMWAFAIWDRNLRRLYLCRDRFGVKPLHYIHKGSWFAFASELKAFLYLPQYQLHFRKDVISRSICSGNYVEATPDTILQSVERLAPGTWLEIRKNEPQPRIERWWNTLDSLPVIDSQTQHCEWVERFSELFEDACALRMRSDVPIGTALSGGLDSSSVYAMLQRNGAKHCIRAPENWHNAFVATYPGTSQDETQYAERLLSHFAAKASFEEMNGPRCLSQLNDFIYSVEEVYPFRGSISLLYQSMRQSGVKISIDGHGGDELLAGYHHYPLVAMLDRAHGANGMPGIGSLKSLYNNLTGKSQNESVQNIRMLLNAYRPDDRFNFGMHYLKTEASAAIFPSYIQNKNELKHRSHLFRSLYFDFHYALLPTILRMFDRLSMAHGVEIRSPFLDYRLVTLAFALPDELKLSGGYTKQILRKSMTAHLPDSICWRKDKIGFLGPFRSWLKDGFESLMMDEAHSSSFLDSDIWDGPKILKRMELARKLEQPGVFEFFWPVVQAHLLIKIFTQRNISHEKP